MPEITSEKLRAMESQNAKAQSEIDKVIQETANVQRKKNPNYKPRDTSTIKVAMGDEQMTSSIFESSLVAGSNYGQMLTSKRGMYEQEVLRPKKELEQIDAALRTKQQAVKSKFSPPHRSKSILRE